jgi:two-component system sensor histidine kinase YesM
VETGNFSVRVPIPTDDEIGQLATDFNIMAEQLHRLVEVAHKSEIAQKEADLKSLRAQVNPHFLYNCLSAINMEALKIEAESISDMAVSLAAFYRTAINKGDELVTLEEELSHARAFADIHRYLKDDSFDVEYRIEKGVERFYVLNLLLYPLIENAIEHGIDGIEGRGRVVVAAKELVDAIEITVADNGPGIAPDTAESALTTESSRYGIQSVQSRIRLRFGEEYGLSFPRNGHAGTTARILLPRICER